MRAELVAWLRWQIAPPRTAAEGKLADLAVYGTNNSGVARKPCGHTRHVGPCPSCQRALLAEWDAQLARAARLGRHR